MSDTPFKRTANEPKSINLSLGEFIVGGRTNVREDWVIYGLGSCIGLILSDRHAQVAGMAHILLPKNPGTDMTRPAKYADTAILTLLEGLTKVGASKQDLVAHMVGGAKMLQVATLGDIGRRNVQCVRRLLAEHEIPIVAQSVGGTVGRTLRWKRERGMALMSQIGKKDIILTPEPFRFG